MSKDSVAHAIAPASTVRTFAETLLPVVSECKWHWNDDGWFVRAVDPGKIALLSPIDVGTQAFEAYDAPGSATVGVNLVRLLDYIKPANADTLVELSVNMETRHLDITFGNTDTSLALIDPEAIRSEPDQPDLDLPNEIAVEGADLKHAHTMTDMLSNHIALQADPDARNVVFSASGDTDETTITLGDEDLLDARVDKDVESLFSNEYFGNLVSPIPDDAEVTIRFGDEFPMRLRYDALDGYMNVGAMLAPRIQTR